MLRTLLTLIVGVAIGRALERSAKRQGRIRPAGALPRIGIFLTGPAEGAVADVVNLFKDEMRCRGWIDGENIEYVGNPQPAITPLRGQAEMSRHARQLIDCGPDIIWLVNTGNAEAVAAAQQGAIKHIPVVGSSVRDRVGVNFTGVRNLSGDLGPARLGLVKQLLLSNGKPLAVAVFYTSQSEEEVNAIACAAPGLGVTVTRVKFDNYGDLESPFSTMPGTVQAVLTTHDQFFRNAAQRIIELAAKRGLPLIGYRQSFVRSGAVMSYGTSLQNQIRMSAELVEAILNGARAGRLDMKRPRDEDRELWINCDAANKLRWNIPDGLRHRPGANVID